MITDRVIAERLGMERRSGYWGVGGRYFFNKAECLRYATSIRDGHVTYYFYDGIYRSLNWKVEPRESLKEMYKRRAQHLRDKYDYLILSFSGGSDSTNILKTFTDNGIKLDEVCCEFPLEYIEKNIHTFDYNRNNPDHIMFEWVMAAKPMLTWLSKAHPETKITVVSGSKDTMSILENSEVQKHERSGLVFNASSRWVKLYEIARDRSKHGVVGFISGVDKPRLGYNPKLGKFYSVYADTNNLIYFPSSSHDQNGYDLFFDHFYLSYEFPEINQKQCFVLKHKIQEVLHSGQQEFYKTLLLRVDNKGTHVYDTHQDFFKTALYESWSNNIFQAVKSDNFFYAPANKWLHDTIANDKRASDFHDKQISEMLYGIDDYFIMKQGGKPSNFKHITSEGIEF